MATSLTARELYSYALRTAGDRTGDQADLEAEDAVNLAIEMLAKERRWPWLRQNEAIAYQAAVQLPITFTQGSATATTTGTWPSWAASGSILVRGHVIDIDTRTDDTNVELEIAWPFDTETAETVPVFQDAYTLPTSCLTVDRLYPGQNWVWGGDPVSLEQFWAARSATTIQLPQPSMWTVLRNNILVYPYPANATLTRLSYYRQPIKPVTDTDEVDWDADTMEPLLRAIEFQVLARYANDNSDQVAAALSLFRDAAKRAAGSDKTTSDLASVGSAWGTSIRAATQRPSYYQRG